MNLINTSLDLYLPNRRGVWGYRQCPVKTRARSTMAIQHKGLFPKWNLLLSDKRTLFGYFRWLAEHARVRDRLYTRISHKLQLVLCGVVVFVRMTSGHYDTSQWGKFNLCLCSAHPLSQALAPLTIGIGQVREREKNRQTASTHKQRGVRGTEHHYIT